jgi:AcrR family transcriptional regulator
VARRAVTPALPEARDGRVRRGERSRQAIVEALLDLVGRGVLQPTAQQVAARAGVGIRSVFRHFSEMERLFAAMDAHLEGDARRLLEGGQRRGRLAQRVRSLVRQRATLFERIAPYKRAANLQRWHSRFLTDRHRELLRALRTDRRQWLPELDGAPADLQEAVDLAICFEAWDRLRGDRQLSQTLAVGVMERTLLALVRDRRRR